MTTANARWANAAEARDRILERLRAEFAEAVEEHAPIVNVAKPKPAKSFSTRLQKIMDKMNRGNV